MIIGSVLSYLTCFGWLPLFLMGLLGFLLHWLFSKMFGKSHTGDLTADGEGALRAESDGLRARIRELEGRLSTSDGEVSSLRTQLSAAPAASVAAPAAAASLTGGAAEAGDDDSYALEWRNRYLAARVKYLEGRLAEAPKASVKKVVAKKATAKKVTVKKAPAKKKAAPKAKPAVKKVAAKKKPAAKKAPKPKVLYTDGPTDGKPDDLKLIKGIGPKFEKDLNGKGIYYFRQIAAWKSKDVDMVEKLIDSIPGRIGRDEWVPQAKGLAKGGKPSAKKAAPKAAKKKPAAKKASAPKVLYTDGPTDGKPDDLKMIKGIGPKFEKDLNGKGIYYFRQIGAWKSKDVDMVEKLIDSIPGRIGRDEWVRQAKGFSTGGKTSAAKASGSKYEKYYGQVRQFHGAAKAGTIDNIAKYLGPSLNNRDSSLVACSDATEMATVAKNFGMRKLGLSQAAAEKAAADTCAEMKPARLKNRVSFYYLMARNVKKLSVFE